MKCYYDFHIHSGLSPCSSDDMSPCNIINMAYIKGLNAIAVSDHNTVGNIAPALEYAKAVGITVLPAMEIESMEEVHILSLFPDYDTALSVEKIVKEHLPPFENDEDIFGKQLLFDAEGKVIGEENQMLIMAATLSINEVFDLVNTCGGVAVPAHIDRHSYSVMSNLGFIPEELNIRIVELSSRVSDSSEYLKNKNLPDFFVLKNSDAHSLEVISEAENFLECEADAKSIISYLKSV